MTAPGEVRDLVARFQEQLPDYSSGRYNEAQLRQDFLNPFFVALGWDVYNERGYSEVHREVIVEYNLRVAQRTKAPDYCFRAGAGGISFFVEAKKPSVDIHKDIRPAYQLRSYGWNKKLQASVLTDFEELALYDCRGRPLKTDRASKDRIFYCKYTEYVDRWDELLGLLSPEAVRRGALDRFVGSKKAKKGTEPVDAEFLKEIEGWRELLAKNIALRNKNISRRDLNFAVQRTIDRMIFLRICEDRGIERYGMLQGLANGAGVYARLAELFQRADERYNSGLFHFTPERGRPEPDEWTLDLSIDDRAVKAVIAGLYDGAYEFSVLPIEILGQVYEQFLGKVIRLTKGHQAKVEEKPEVKKAGGVYYTPSYIVDYIVRQTVGKLIDGKKPQQVAKLRVLDPACGSGSFLIGAYRHLLEWHQDYYEQDDPQKHARGRNPKLCRGRAGQWRLTTAEKKRILLNNIYGVDIDPQAVEVTKLSLLLQVLDGETEETVANQLRLFQERALPDLAENIKCGNSLIGPDFYHNRQRSLLDDEEEMYRINVFDWQKEFSDIFKGKTPGFDAVIGNPPYGALANDAQIDYYRHHYASSSGSCDSFALFTEKSSDLLHPGGIFGMIVQSAFVSAPSMSKLRDVFVDRFKPRAFASMPYDVFAAYIDTVIVVAERLKQKQCLAELGEAIVELTVFPPRFKVRSVEDFTTFAKTADAAKWMRDGHNEFLVTMSDAERAIIDRLHASGARFGDFADIQRGVTPFKTSLDMPDVNPARAFKGTVRRYKFFESEPLFIQYDQTLAEFKPPRYFAGPRLLLRELISRQFQLQAVYTDQDFITNKSMQSLLIPEGDHHILFFLGLLNSAMLSWYFLAVHSVGRRDDFPKIVLKQSRELPFRPIDFNSKRDKSRHDRIVSLVETMLSLHARLATAKSHQDKTVMQRQIDATDAQIDRLVYKLYGLTENEIKIVEEATA